MVGVRIRPVTDYDSQTARQLARVSGRLYDKSVWVKRQEDLVVELDRHGRDRSDSDGKKSFNLVFGPEQSTQDIWEHLCASVVNDVVQGFNASIIAYGQTGSGKTHSLMGNDQGPGLIILAIHSMFRSITEGTNSESLVRVSYAEIFDEELRDLFQPDERELKLADDKERGAFIEGLQVIFVLG